MTDQQIAILESFRQGTTDVLRNAPQPEIVHVTVKAQDLQQMVVAIDSLRRPSTGP